MLRRVSFDSLLPFFCETLLFPFAACIIFSPTPHFWVPLRTVPQGVVVQISPYEKGQPFKTFMHHQQSLRLCQQTQPDISICRLQLC